jgi:hypothetical protein
VGKETQYDYESEVLVMSQRASNDLNLPSCLPTGLRVWAWNIIVSNDISAFECDIDKIAWGERATLRRLLSDTRVATDLCSIANSLPDSQRDAAIKEWLSETLWAYSLLRHNEYATPSEVKMTLKQIAAASDALADLLSKNSKLLGPAIFYGYLEKRLKEDDPRGFSNKRGGLRIAQWSIRNDTTTMVDLLEALSADISEELRDFPQRIDNRGGRQDSWILFLIKLVKTSSQKLFGSVNAAALARLLSVLTGETIDSSRIKRVRT